MSKSHLLGKLHRIKKLLLFKPIHVSIRNLSNSDYKRVYSMPAIVGAVKVNSIGNSSVMNIGDVFQISPSSTAKTFAGAGSFNTGDGLRIYNNQSVTNTYDTDSIDSVVIGNA